MTYLYIVFYVEILLDYGVLPTSSADYVQPHTDNFLVTSCIRIALYLTLWQQGKVTEKLVTDCPFNGLKQITLFMCE
jgi:hypothetical protein